MTVYESLPIDICDALYDYCKDDECLNDALLRALRNELKIEQTTEKNRYSHDCVRCDKCKELKKQIENLRIDNTQLENANVELLGKIAFTENALNNAKTKIEDLNRKIKLDNS